MINHQAQETYLRMQVQTAAPWELTTLLFSGCIKFMKQAMDAINRKDYEAKNLYIKKSVDIIDELTITLNRDYDIAHQLASLYTYMKDQLFQANIKNHVDFIQECVVMLTELRDTWVQAMKTLHTSRVNA
ncbi:flagellar export chaperone FliS [Paenibacillus terrigena]|uniref:flagellar export chaperone FliS n=1 Tax=Paenibacillus terrigena TaxID=369333 RepID=UPI00035EE9E3|nr:flagellar export chaperone FliS [Paenibacillus terrigena]